MARGNVVATLKPASALGAVTRGRHTRHAARVRAFVINPRRDADFVARVEKEGPTAESPAELQQALRKGYPKAVVRPRQLEGERAEVWYVYREGTWVAD